MNTRAITIPLVVVSIATVLVLVVASAVSPGGNKKVRTPLGDVRIEKVLDFQLPEV